MGFFLKFCEIFGNTYFQYFGDECECLLFKSKIFESLFHKLQQRGSRLIFE